MLTPFEYFEPNTVEEAVNMLQQYGEKARTLAGGVDLLARIRRREIEPECVVCIQRISGLDYVKEEEGRLKIGALSNLRSIELSPLVKENYPLLYDAVHSIHSIQVKNMGTAVGNLCIATPASDVAASLIALGAALRIAGPSSDKTVPLEDFYVGVRKTMLKPSEMVAEISVQRPSVEAHGAFLKLVRTATDIPKVNVAVMLTLKNHICEDARIVLGSVAPRIFRAKKAEETVKGKTLEPDVIGEAADVAAEEAKPITDIRSTEEYRREMCRVLTFRALDKLRRETGG